MQPVDRFKKPKKGKEELHFWKLHFGMNNLEEIPSEIGLLKMIEADATDTEIGYIAKRIKHIDEWNLNNSDISDDGVQHMLQLEYIRDLRLKSNRRLTNDCMTYLDQLTSLEFIHLGSTGVTVDGLLKIPHLTKLKEILISDPGTPDLAAKMRIVMTALPACRFIINSKEYEDPDAPPDYIKMYQL